MQDAVRRHECMEDSVKHTQPTQDKPWASVRPTGRMYRPSAVVDLTGLSRSQIYQMISEGRFPPFIPLSTRAVALPESWLDAFLEARAQAALELQTRR